MKLCLKSKKKWSEAQKALFKPVRPNRGNNLPFFAAVFGISSSMLPGNIAVAETVPIDHAYIFTLQSMITHGGESLVGTAFLENLKDRYIGRPTSLVEIKSIKDEIHEFYNDSEIENVKISINLPRLGQQNLHIFIEEPQKIKRRIVNSPLVTNINFTGEITADPEGILALADKYIDKPYTLVNILTLKKKLKEYYANNTDLTPDISLPDFDAETGDVYIDINETPSLISTKRPVNNKNLPLIETVLNDNDQGKVKLFEVSKNILLLAPSPEEWKEPLWQKSKKRKAVSVKAVSKQTKASKNDVVKPVLPVEVQPKVISEPKLAMEKKVATVKARTEFLTQEYHPPKFTKISDSLILIDRDDNDLLILELIVDGKRRSAGLSAYIDYNNDLLYMPISELAEALSFPLEVDSKKGKISGFFLNTENTFELDMNEQTLFINGDEEPFPMVGLEASHYDVYATVEIIQSWFPVEVSLKYAEQRLEISSTKELPYQAYAKRQDIWRQVKESGNLNRFDAPKKILKRKLFSAPSIYSSLNSTISRSSEDEITSTNSLNLQASADVMRMSGRISANITYNSQSAPDIKDVKATLTKLDPEGQILGVLKATQLEIGDVDFQPQPLLSVQTTGRGVFISNQHVTNIRDPENFVIKGNGPVDWDVEVYQNGLLLDFQKIASDGTYNFSTIPLRTGRNIFEIKLFGPNGERREHTEEFYLGQGVIKKGEFTYDFIATQSSSDLISTDEDDNENQGMVSLSGGYGLHKKISVFGGIYTGAFSGIEETGNAYTAGIKTSFFGADLQTDYISQSNDASAYQFIARRKIGDNMDINFSYRKNENFTQAENDILEEKSVTLNKSFKFEIIPDFHFRVKWQDEKRLSGVEQQKVSTRVGTKILGINLTNNLDTTLRDTSDLDVYTGSLTASGRLQYFDIRSRVNYTLGDGAKLSQINAGVNGKLSNSLNFTGNVTQNFDNGIGTANYDSRVSYRLPKADIGFSLGGDTDGGVRVGINLSSYILPSDEGYSFNSSQNAAYGGVQVSVRAFLDDNQNGVFDDNEKTLEDVAFRYRKRGKIARTNEDGIATLTGLSPFSNNLISIDILSLSNIYLKPVHTMMNIMGRPYQHGSIDFPLRLVGEASGEVTYFENGSKRALSGITLNMVSHSGEIVDTAISEFDGYYMFTSVPMGKFTIEISEQDLSMLNSEVNIQKPTHVTLESEEPFVDGLDIYIHAKEKSPQRIIDNDLLNMVKELLAN